MSETANPVVPTSVENNSNVLKTEQDKPATNDVVPNETKINNDLAPTKEATTPAAGRQPRRKRASEVVDSSLVISTPGGDGNRRQTRSQTRGTPAPAPTPAKKPALAEKASNGSAAKGRRGRPPKVAGDEKPVESVPMEEDEPKEEPVTKAEPEKKVEVKPKEEVKPAKPEKAEDKVDSVTSTTPAATPVTTEKVVPPPPEVKPIPEKEEAKPEPQVKVATENSQEPAKEPVKEKIIEKPVIDIEKPTEKAVAENKVVNNENAETVNNHEQA